MSRAGPTQTQLNRVARYMRRAAKTGITDGRESPAMWDYIERCRRTIYGTTIIFTRDGAMHSSGWLKNPDYERCYHLSLSATPGRLWTRDTPDLDKGLTAGWLRAFFGADARLALAESPKTRAGQRHGVWHWRLFCDERWQTILPRKEVYSRDFTVAGWKTASELGVTIDSPLGATP